MSYANTEVAQIAAISRNRCIGKGNDLPWHISADLQHFKSMTTKQSDGAIQGIVIMGRKTFESMGSKPLPKRVSFIISTQMDYAEQKGLVGKDNAHVVHNLDDAQIRFLKKHRHYGVDIWLFSQAYNDVDNKFRELTTLLIMLKKTLIPFQIKGMAIKKTMDLINGQIVEFFEWDKTVHST